MDFGKSAFLKRLGTKGKSRSFPRNSLRSSSLSGERIRKALQQQIPWN